MQAAYVGTLAHRLPLTVDANYPVLTATATTANVDQRRPYQPLNTLSTIGMMKSILNSAYHGLQITGEKRASRTFSVRGYYTFGKSLDFIDSQNSTTQAPEDWNNINLDRGRTINDRRHNAVDLRHLEAGLFPPIAARGALGGGRMVADGHHHACAAERR